MSIELRHVSFSYSIPGNQPIQALSDVNLIVEDGAFVGIMGRTGCGKTTLIQLIDGLICPSSGQVFIDGQDINNPAYDKQILRKKVGLVFQYPEIQLFETTVERDVAFGLKHSGLTEEEVRGRVQWAIETMGFDFQSIRNLSPVALSGGEKRRIAIAGVLVTRPDILIFDEPVAGLDPNARESFISLVSELNRNGTTILMISHNADILAAHAKRILILSDGKVVLDGTPEQVSEDIEQLNSFDAGVSSARKTAFLLQQHGMDFPQNIVSTEELISALRTQLKKGKE